MALRGVTPERNSETESACDDRVYENSALLFAWKVSPRCSETQVSGQIDFARLNDEADAVGAGFQRVVLAVCDVLDAGL